MTLYYLVSGVLLTILGIWWNPKTVIDSFLKLLCLGIGITGLVFYIKII